MFPGDPEQLGQPLVIASEFDGHVRRLIAYLVEQTIQPRPVQKGKINALGLNVARERSQICLLTPLRRAHVIANVAFLEVIENVRPSIHAAGLERTFLLGKIVERNVSERNIVKVEITAKVQLSLDELREPTPENAAAGHARREPAQRSQRFEGRVFWIINEVAPVPMIRRPAPRKDRWHTSRAISED